MANSRAPFWRLDSRLGWYTATRWNIAIGAHDGLRLEADRADGRAQGPLSLMWGDGSLGGVVLPKGMAFDADGHLYLLSPFESAIKRYAPERKEFVSLLRPTKGPAGGSGADGRTLTGPIGLAISGRKLYIVDEAEHRVQVFAQEFPYPLIYLWGPWDGEGRAVAPDSERAWDPVDVAAYTGMVYVLDARYGRVYRQRCGSDRLELFISDLEQKARWTRLVVDRTGILYLLDEQKPRVVRYTADGTRMDERTDAGDIRDNFDPPLIRLRYRTLTDKPWTGRFQLPTQLAACESKDAVAPVFDRAGNPATLAPDEPMGPYLYAREGVWVSTYLDSRIYRCQWHRIEFDLVDTLPPGAQVKVSTFSTDDDSTPIPPPDSQAWDAVDGFIGPMQQGAPQPVDDEPPDLLVQSREGQFLAIMIRLQGDGYATPTIHAVRVYYPRSSYLKYLPALYSSDDRSRWFLERYLSLFQTEWEQLGKAIDTTTALFDPAAVPDRFLDYIASWLALPLEGRWNTAQKRAMLQAAPRFYPLRGTAAGLRLYLQVYLQNMTGNTIKQLGEYPVLVEGFRQRQRVMLRGEDGPRLDQQALLWGPAQVGRLQLGVFATEGEVRLVATENPERDLFTEYAHRFRVYVPSVWIRTAKDEQMLRRAIQAEKPAQTAYDLCLVEPRIQVGIQSTVGINMIIGEYPVARLPLATCGDAATAGSEDVPPSREPRGRLGYDTILAGCVQPAGAVFTVG